MEFEFVSEEFARDIEFLTADYNDVLPVENLFGDGRGETTWACERGIRRIIPRRCPLPSMTTVFSKVVISGGSLAICVERLFVFGLLVGPDSNNKQSRQPCIKTLTNF